MSNIVPTLAAVARHFGVAKGTVYSKWQRKGMPGKKGAWDLDAIYEWRKGLNPNLNRYGAQQKDRSEISVLGITDEEMRLFREKSRSTSGLHYKEQKPISLTAEMLAAAAPAAAAAAPEAPTTPGPSASAPADTDMARFFPGDPIGQARAEEILAKARRAQAEAKIKEMIALKAENVGLVELDEVEEFLTAYLAEARNIMKQVPVKLQRFGLDVQKAADQEIDLALHALRKKSERLADLRGDE